DAARLDAAEWAGELSLAGELRPVRGALALALALQAESPGRPLVLPEVSACSAARVRELDARAAHTLAQVVASHALLQMLAYGCWYRLA
ncbi:MAG: hypothetical protein ACK57B_00700, partial [Betaproteobacteria bacterium]